MKASVIVAASLTVLLAACGQKESAAPAPAPAASAPAPAPAAPAAAAPAAANSAGSGVFNKVCSLCHAAGVGGAPKVGDKADWGPRIAQGKDVLYKHALEGFTGQKGMMPARGASASLTDDEVKSAVDYMVSKAE